MWGNVTIKNSLEDEIIEIQGMLERKIEGNESLSVPEMRELSGLLDSLRDMIARIQDTPGLEYDQEC